MKTNGMPRGYADYASAHRQKRRWLKIVTCLAAVVIFCTVYALVLPAVTLESRTTCCGMEEHTHGESCYEAALICGLEEDGEHIHDESCYEKQLICELSEHTHTDECYVNPEETAQDSETVTEEAGEDQTDAGKNESQSGQTEEDAGESTAAETQIQDNPQSALEAAPLPDGAQIPEGYTERYTVRDEEKGYAVTVHTPEGVLPADAMLSAELLDEKDEDYLRAREEMGDQPCGFAALDIHFEDAAGNEVEPAGDVYVVLDADGLLPLDADPGSVTVQHHARQDDGQVNVETVADTKEETEGVVTAQAEESSGAVQAAFAVDSFSTFTISWVTYGGNASEITIYCVDEKGNSIGEDLKDIERSREFTMEDIAPEIEGYTYRRALIAQNATSVVNSGTEFTKLRRINRAWQYYSVSGRSWRGVSNNRVYLVYGKEITTVETVDSTAQGVHMYMFDYPGEKFSDGGYGSGDVKEGLASRTVNEKGWPSLTGKSSTPSGQSFSELFDSSAASDAYSLDDANAVNHLFLKSRFDEDGTFYYSSFENFATLQNDNDNNFTLYDALGTPSSENNYFYQRGNFMPYNTLDFDKISNRNLYSDTGERLPEDDPHYNDPVYGFNEENNFYFGMYVWADFYQPQNGQVEDNDGSSSKDMVFEFTGDDDMWVYIDGVLVLDLGGIHDAQSGSINFASGEIRYTDTKTNGEPVWYESTLKDMFAYAGKADSVDWKGDTFADGSSHRIQIFYMERGAGASNLKISFNLKTIPDGQLSVEKDVEHYYAPQLSGIKYTMQVTVNGRPYADQPYTFYEQEGGGTTDADGQFQLEHGQTAVFPDLKADDKVVVKEVGTSDTPDGVEISKNYDIAYTVTDGAGNSTGDAGTDGTITATMPGYGSIRVRVTNTATFTRPLKLVKKFEGTEQNSAPNGFEATYTLYEKSGSEEWSEVGSVKHSDLINGEYIFWLETGKLYKIQEDFGDGDNRANTEKLIWKEVVSSTNDPASGTDAADGIISLDPGDDATGEMVDTIELTNRYGAPTVSLTIIKKIYGLSEDETERLITENPLRFDVDGYTDAEYLINDEKGVSSGYPEGHDDWNDWGDRTFSVKDTLDGSGFVSDNWNAQISTPGGTSIAPEEEMYYTDISMEKVTDDSGEYYRYEVTITDMPADVWFRVWEMNPSLNGFDLEAKVSGYLTGSDELVDNYLTEESVLEQTDQRGDHGGRTTAFLMKDDTTVEFTDIYSELPDVTVTKVDSADNTKVLSGASFHVVNEEGKYYSYDKETDTAVWVDEQENATLLTSDENGKFTIMNLEDGKYELRETRAPDGYQLPEKYFVFTLENGVVIYVSDGQASKLPEMTVSNTTGIKLPETGGSGTDCMTIGGLLLMAAAVGSGYGLRRRRGREGK